MHRTPVPVVHLSWKLQPQSMVGLHFAYNGRTKVSGYLHAGLTMKGLLHLCLH